MNNPSETKEESVLIQARIKKSLWDEIKKYANIHKLKNEKGKTKQKEALESYVQALTDERNNALKQLTDSQARPLINGH